MPIPQDYVERVYAGVLGKIIGVYLGRPFEGWSYEKITAELGPINYYVHEQRGVPLVVTDDDISGTFTFIRALEDHGNSPALTAAQIGQSWLNYIIEQRAILWWGGMGMSTEHTAFLRLKHGTPAPASGSIAVNGKTVAEQIGAQIFIDGWAMVAPGNPQLAADLAKKAASVSHDGEAIYGAQVVAAIEAMAFVEQDIEKLIDTAVTFIPRDSVIYRMIDDIRGWRRSEPSWEKAREQLAAKYGYDKYGGGCHMVPNHGLIILALLYGDGEFQKSLMIANTCGWDTDCNSGNVGCIMGIRNGLAGIDAGPDWRGPIADRIFLPTADPGRCITDALAETYRIVNMGRALAGQGAVQPKNGARFHFDAPGAVQGFVVEDSPDTRGVTAVSNVKRGAGRALAIRFEHLAPGRAARAATATFVPREALSLPHYSLIASPTLSPGQVVRAIVEADATTTGTVSACIFTRSYGPKDALVISRGPAVTLAPGKPTELQWKAAAEIGMVIAEVGVEITSPHAASGTVYLDHLTWDGAPDVTLGKPAFEGTVWQRQWADGMNSVWYASWIGHAFMPIQNDGRGLLIHGCREWTDYRVGANFQTYMVRTFGLAARVQGMRRYYALLLSVGGRARLVKCVHDERELASTDFDWSIGGKYAMDLRVDGPRIRASIDGRELFDVSDTDPLGGGGVAIVCEEGRVGVEAVRIQPTC